MIDRIWEGKERNWGKGMKRGKKGENKEKRLKICSALLILKE